MRRLLTFACRGHSLAGSLDGSAGPVGILMVTGGAQIRGGPHRMYERLAVALVDGGYPCFRFDRRGVGDSEGTDAGFRGSEPDIEAALAAFRAECPGLERIVGFGLGDGATALALFGERLGLDALILANPQFVETGEKSPAPIAVQDSDREALTSPGRWRRLLTGRVSMGKTTSSAFADQVAKGLEKAPPTTLILSRSDATGATAEALWNSRDFSSARGRHPAPIPIASDSHSFAKTGDGDALAAACLTVLDGLGKRD